MSLQYPKIDVALATTITVALIALSQSTKALAETVVSETSTVKPDCYEEKVSAIGLQGFSVTLKNSTVWTIPGSAAGNVFYWQPEDTVKVCGNRITNLSTQQTVKCTAVKRGEKHSKKTDSETSSER